MVMCRAVLRYTSLGKQIRAARHDKGWSQEKLAELLGCQRQRIILWEKGANRPKLKYRALLQELLKNGHTFDWSADEQVMSAEEAVADLDAERHFLDERPAA